MNKEELEKLVKESYSFTEVLNKQGKAVSGAAVKVLKETLDAYGIDYHNLYERLPKDKKEITLDGAMVENSEVSRKRLKFLLIENGIKKNCCEKCGNQGYWNGEPLVMHLHHINGIRNDNRLENLIMLCPNCHSQTENYAGGQRKKIKYCPDCGVVINNRSSYCPKCSAKRRVKVQDKPSKEELVEMIKKESFVAIGKKYNVSDKAVAKWCKNYGLPFTRKQIKDLFG